MECVYRRIYCSKLNHVCCWMHVFDRLSLIAFQCVEHLKSLRALYAALVAGVAGLQQ